MAHRVGDAELTYIDPEYNCPRFTGKVIFHPDRLNRFNKKKPTVFSIWNDLFHDDVEEVFIKQFLKVVHHSNQHTFLILTKRPKRMTDLFCRLDTATTIHFLLREFNGTDVPETAMLGFKDVFPNIYSGLTICNQQEADEKIPIFLQVPGKKFLSIEPLLKEINIPFNTEYPDADGCYEDMRHHIKQVVLGCETGAKARPMSLDWARQIVERCKAANVPLFIKALTINGKPNHNIEQWPEDLRIRELVW